MVGKMQHAKAHKCSHLKYGSDSKGTNEVEIQIQLCQRVPSGKTWERLHEEGVFLAPIFDAFKSIKVTRALCSSQPCKMGGAYKGYADLNSKKHVKLNT